MSARRALCVCVCVERVWVCVRPMGSRNLPDIDNWARQAPAVTHTHTQISLLCLCQLVQLALSAAETKCHLSLWHTLTHTQCFFPHVKGFIKTMCLVSESLHHSQTNQYALNQACCFFSSSTSSSPLWITHSWLEVIFKKSVLTGSFWGWRNILSPFGFLFLRDVTLWPN